MEHEVPTSLSSGGSTSREPHGGVSDSVHCPKSENTCTPEPRRLPTIMTRNSKNYTQQEPKNIIQNHKNTNHKNTNHKKKYKSQKSEPTPVPFNFFFYCYF